MTVILMWDTSGKTISLIGVFKDIETADSWVESNFKSLEYILTEEDVM